MSWLSIGKSFQAPVVASTEQPSSLSAQPATNAVRDEIEHDRKSSKHKRKHSDDQERRSSKKHKKDKHKKKDKKNKDERRMVVRDATSHKQTGVLDIAKDYDYSSSSDGFSSSDDEARHKSTYTKDLLRAHQTEIVNGTSEVMYLPNGEVFVLPKATSSGDTSNWYMDTRGDKDMFLYEGVHPRDVVLYTLHTGAVYANSLDSAAVAAHTGRFNNGAGIVTSDHLLRRSQQRPSGITVSATKQLRDYHEASKLEQIFRHRTQLLTERKKELRLKHKFRYFSPASRNILMEPFVKRLAMRVDLYDSKGADEKPNNGSQLNVAVMLPLPYVDANLMRDLNFSTGPGSASSAPPATSSAMEQNEQFQSCADREQTQANLLTRQVNQQLRDNSADVRSVLAAVSSQDTLSSLQRVAAGRSPNAFTSNIFAVSRRANKTDLALQKATAERKISILEQAILNHPKSAEHSTVPLYEALIHQFATSKQVDKVEAAYKAAIKDHPLNLDLRYQQWTHQLSQFQKSDYHTLSSSLSNMHANVVHTAHNMQAAAELNRLVDNTLSGGAGGGSKLQQEYAHLLLQRDLVAAQCDQLLHRILLERAAGHTERSIAIVQAVLDFNLSDNRAVSAVEYCSFWDSEAPRLGEINYSSGVSPQTATEVSTTGYDAWVRAGRPAEPSDDRPLPGASEVMRPDDYAGVYNALEGAYMSALVSEFHGPVASAAAAEHQDKAVSTRAIVYAAPSSCAVVGTVNSTSALAPPLHNNDENENENKDLNAAAADYFLQQILDSQLLSAENETEAEGEAVGDLADEDRGGDAESGSETRVPQDSWSTAHSTTPGTLDIAGPSEPAVSNTGREISTDAGEEEGWVYSRLHGYKIKISKENSGAIYKKILTEMSTTGEGTSDEVATSAHSTQASAALNSDRSYQARDLPTFTDPIYSQWRGDVYAKCCQFRPLRVLSPHDAAAVEQQPERAIFSDDLKSSLLRTDIDTASTMYDVSMRQELKQRLIVRCLQGLGVVLPSCECSHSAVPRSVQVLLNSANMVNAEEDVLFRGIMHGKSGAEPSITQSPPSDSAQAPASGIGAVVGKLQRGGWGASGICTVQSHLIRKHLVCSKFGFDSELSFLIRFVTDIVRRATASVSGPAQVNFSRDCVLSAVFLSQLRRVLVRLLTVRHLCDVSLADGTAHSADSASTRQGELLEEWRRRCRGIIESTVVPSDSAAANASASVVRIPAVGDLSMWAEYLTAESMLGNQVEALKLADRVWKSLLTDAQSGAQAYHGIAQLALASVYIATNLLPPPLLESERVNSCAVVVVNKQQVAAALNLAVYVTHSGALVSRDADTGTVTGACHSTFGTYNSALKPPKKAGKKGAGEPLMAVDAAGVAAAVEVLQAKVLELVHHMQDQLQAARRTQRVQQESGAVQLHVPYCVDLDCSKDTLSLVVLMAWVQYLSHMNSSTSAPADTDGGAGLADKVFTAAIALITNLLFPDAPSSEQLSTSGTGACRYSKHLLRLLPGSAPSSSSTTAVTAAADANAGVAGSEYFTAPLNSEPEVKALVLLERLHTERILFHLTTAALSYAPQDPPSDAKMSGQSPMRRVVRTDRALAAAATALLDFPLNRYFQCLHTTLTVAQPGGYLQMRAHFRNVSHSRWLWGGGLQPCECLLLVQLEIYQACKLLQYDPCCPALAAHVDLFALFDADSALSSLDSASSGTTKPLLSALSLYSYWSADCASKVRTVLEYVLSTPQGSQLPSLWLLYIFMLTSRGRNEEAKKVFFRAVNHCGWCQKLFLSSIGPLRGSFSDKEVASLQSMIEQRGLGPVRDIS